MKSRNDVWTAVVILFSGWVLLFSLVSPLTNSLLWSTWDYPLSYETTLSLAVFTEFGSQFGIFFVATVIYWVVDRQLGKKLVLLFIVSGWVNIFLKGLFAIPRPSDPKTIFLIDLAFPSGHTQMTASIFNYLALHYNQMIHFAIFIILTTGIAISRVMLRVHYTADVLGGVFFGCLVSLAFFRFQEGVSTNRVLEKNNVRAFMVLVLPLLALGLIILLWDRKPVIIFQLAGTATGFGIGDTLLRMKRVPFPKRHVDKVLMVFFGVTMVTPFLFLLHVMPSDTPWLHYLLMGVIGFSISWAIPSGYFHIRDFLGFH